MLALSGPVAAQQVGPAPPPPACTTFGTTTGTCVQGAGALGTPSSGNGSNITNVNAATLGGATFASPGAIGGTTPSTVASTGVTLNGGTQLVSYSSGTWPCGISFGGGTTGITYDAQNCIYTKVGRVVTVSGGIAMSNKGSSTGIAKITGLPYTTAAGTYNQYSYNASIDVTNVTLTALPKAGTWFTGSATTLDLYTVTIADAQTQLTNTAFANGSQVFLSLTYLATVE